MKEYIIKMESTIENDETVALICAELRSNGTRFVAELRNGYWTIDLM